jgi:hypothetical protein
MPEIVRQAEYYGLQNEGLDRVSSYDKIAQEELDDLLAGPRITPGYLNY